MALKLGSEDKKKVIIASVLGVVVIALLFNVLGSYFSNGSAPAAPPPTVPVQTAAARSARATTADHTATRIPGIGASLDPTLHPEWMAQAESLEYSGHGRNIFSQFSTPAEIEKVAGPIRPSAPMASVAQGPPPPPPIELKFFGYEAHKDGTRKAFLLHGDDVFIASEGDVVDHRYRVLKIAPFSVQVEDIPYQNAQPLPLTQN